MTSAPAKPGETITIDKTEFERLLDKTHTPAHVGVFQDAEQFKHAQRVAVLLCSSGLAPTHFKGEENIGSAVIAVDMAFRLGMNPLMVMQQLYVVHGKPGWSAQFVIAVINASGRFTPLRFRYSGKGETRECIAYSTDIKSGETLEGTPVSIALAKAEGWFSKQGSKWQSMSEQMLAYRSASFWGRMYAPEMFMGLPTTDEIKDIQGQPGTEVETETANVVFGKAANEKPAEITERGRVAGALHPHAPQQTAAIVTSTTATLPAETKPEEKEAPPKAAQTPQEEFGDFMIDNGVAFDDFRDWIANRNLVPDHTALASFTDLPPQAVDKLRADTKALANCIKIYGKAKS